MSDTTHSHLFGAKEYAGVRLMEFEEEGYGAPGHVDPAQMTEAIRAYVAHGAAVWGNEPEMVALLVEDVPDAGDVEQVWATYNEEDRRFTWAGVTQDTEGAFPMTVVEP